MHSELKRISWKASLLVVIFSLLGVTIALAAHGALDTTFGTGGKLTTDFGSHWVDQAFGLAVQSNGKIVAVGQRYDPANVSTPATANFIIARYTSNGHLDTSFNGVGRRTIDFGGLDAASAVAIQPNGKILVSGKTCSAGFCKLAVARLNTNGTLDGTFNHTGKNVVPFGTDSAASSGLAIQSNGKIVIAGYMLNSSGDYDFAVYRLNSNGSLDNSFSGDGKFHFGFGAASRDQATSLVLQGSKILVAGYKCDLLGSNCDFALARVTSSGVLDHTFNGIGKQTNDFGASESANAIALTPNGKIVVAGFKSTGSASFFALARYDANGNLDPTFGNSGRRTVALGVVSNGLAMRVLSDGRIIMAGNTSDGGKDDDFGLIRLTSSGNLDATFSNDGKVRIDFGGREYPTALVLQGGGKYLMGGYTSSTTDVNFALARVLP